VDRAPWGWWRRHALLVDVALVAVVLTYSLPILPQVPGADGRVGPLTVVSLALGAAYLAPRRRPWPAFGGMVALAPPASDSPSLPRR